MGAPLREGGIDFVGTPELAAFHAASDDDSLPGNMPGESVGREKDRGVGHVIGPGDLGEGHGGSHFFDHGSIA